jgi:hypothetical protein
VSERVRGSKGVSERAKSRPGIEGHVRQLWDLLRKTIISHTAECLLLCAEGSTSVQFSKRPTAVLTSPGSTATFCARVHSCGGARPRVSWTVAGRPLDCSRHKVSNCQHVGRPSGRSRGQCFGRQRVSTVPVETLTGGGGGGNSCSSSSCCCCCQWRNVWRLAQRSITCEIWVFCSDLLSIPTVPFQYSRTNRMHFLYSVYYDYQPVHVWSNTCSSSGGAP